MNDTPEPATLDKGEVKLTTRSSAQSRARADRPVPAALVVVPSSVLATLPPAALSHLAGVIELPLSDIRRAVKDGAPLVVSTVSRRGAAPAELARHQQVLSMPLAQHAPPGFGRIVEILFFLGAGAAGLATAAATGVAGMAIAGAVGAALSAVSVFGGWRSRRDFRTAVDAWEAQEDLRGSTAEGLATISALRRELAESELPDTVLRDLRDALEPLEQPGVDRALRERGLAAVRQTLADVGQRDERAATHVENVARNARKAMQETR